MKIAVSGKGGVGKTTVAASLVKLFADTHGRVYAIDADPDACLAAGVGIDEEIIRNHKPMVELKEIMDRKNAGGGAFYTLNPEVDDVLEDYSIKEGNVRFLRMGGVKKGGEACYCKENSFLSAVISSLLLDKDEVVVMDMGAGIEHLSRGTARGVDMMLVVVEPSRNSVNTAQLVKKLAEDLGIKRIRFIANKVRNIGEEQFILKNFGADEVIGVIPFDEAVWESAMLNGPAAELGGTLLQSMKEIRAKIEREAGEQTT